MQPRVTKWCRSDGLFYARVYWPGQKTPSRYSLGTRDETLVDQAVQAFIEEKLPLLHPPDATAKKKQSTGIAQLIDWYLNTHLPFMGIKEKTKNNYAGPLRAFEQFCRYRHIGTIEQIGTRVIQDWQLAQSKVRPEGQPVARRDEILTVKRWIEACAANGQIAAAPSVAWNIPKKSTSSRFRAVPAEELAQFLQRLRKERPVLYPVAAWTAASGWRISDVMDLRAGEIKAEHIDRQQLKTSKGMLYPLTPALREILALVHYDPKAPAVEHIFKSDKGEPWTYFELQKRLGYWQEKAGFDISFRDLRKTFGTRLAMAGCPPNVLKELLGHEDIQTTLTHYVEVDMGSMAQWATRYGEGLQNPADTPGQVP